ncbi:MAG: biopolymer transporter ExbD [Rikenellaceae bacterium]|jgi:biopolymer transport protein ExbD|nr:biopolymer transporter ExbD [Rikenellaceae bacterium]
MAVFRKNHTRELPCISTASLPDVIFMLLFFFMASTSMRRHEELLAYRLPAASEAERLEKKSLASYIYIGQGQGQGSDLAAARTVNAARTVEEVDACRIQLNGSVVTLDDIAVLIAAERAKIPEGRRAQMSVEIKADRRVRMGLIAEVKRQLRQASVSQVVYVAVEE